MTADTDSSATDDTKPSTDASSATDDAKPPEKSGDIVAMEAALKKANKEAETHRLKLKELEDAGKSELQKTSDERDEHKSARTAAELRALQLEVALDKGLSATQAKRLIGTTREELEADADELVDSFAPGEEGANKGKPASRPTERLRGGGTGTLEAEETDPRKLAAQIPRRGF